MGRTMGILAVAGAVTLTTVISVTQAQAAVGSLNNPPPKGYPTASQKCSVTVPGTKVKMITRLGFYDSVVDHGFGYDKAYNKHGITSCGAINFVLLSPVSYATSTGKATQNYDAWAEKLVNGKVVEEIPVTPVYEYGNWATYYGWPAGSPLGLMTIFCNNADNSAKCPSWVNLALASGVHAAAQASSSGQTNVAYEASYSAHMGR
jgi:hypothetical protein